MLIKTWYPNLLHGCDFLCFNLMNYWWALRNIYHTSFTCKASFSADVGSICTCFLVSCDSCVNNSDVSANEKAGKTFWARSKVSLAKELFMEAISKMLCSFEVFNVAWVESWYLPLVLFNIEYTDWINLKLIMIFRYNLWQNLKRMGVLKYISATLQCSKSRGRINLQVRIIIM